MCSDAGSELEPIMLLHEGQRSPPPLTEHVSPPKLAFAVNDCAHAFASAAVAKFDGLPVSKLLYVPMSESVDMKQSLWNATRAFALRDSTSRANTGRRTSTCCRMPSAAYASST